MAQFVGGFLLPHDPLITSNPNAPAKEAADAVKGAFAQVSRRLVEMKVDSVIVIGDDHYTVMGPHCIPRCLIAIGDADGPVEPWVGIPRAKYRVDQELALQIMNYGFANRVDWSIAKSITLDHSTALPIHFCVQPHAQMQVVPVLVNSGVEPLISNTRCYEIGQSIRQAIEAWNSDRRVAVLGTGGLSHWVGMAEMGRVNEAWDRMIIQAVESGSIDRILGLTDADIIEQAGNGALEIKNWITALGMAGQTKGRLIEYVPVPEWVTGCGFMEFAA